MWTVTVGEDGTVELPQSMLEELNWKEGDTLYYEIRDDAVYVRAHTQE